MKMTNNTDRAAVARWLGWEYKADEWWHWDINMDEVYDDGDKFLAAIKAELRELKVKYDYGWDATSHYFVIYQEGIVRGYCKFGDTELAAALAAVRVMMRRKSDG